MALLGENTQLVVSRALKVLESLKRDTEIAGS